MKKVASILIVIRILILMAIPITVLASDNKENDEIKNKTKKESSLVKIENGEFKKIYFQEKSKNPKSIFSQVISTIEYSEDEDQAKAYNRISNYKFSGLKKNMKILVTGYSSTPDQCWGDPFTTASGTRVHKGTMACPVQYSFGTEIEIEGMGIFVCEDRGGAINGNHFDMWFESRGQALAWGKRTVEADIKF